MSHRGNREFILDISEACTRIISYTENMSYNEFLKNIKTHDAVLGNIEIIGEAVKNLSNIFKAENPEIEWRKIAGMRDRLIHFYFG